jgi:hypothetical protein
MENKKITLLDFLGACILGAVIGAMLAIAMLGGL